MEAISWIKNGYWKFILFDTAELLGFCFTLTDVEVGLFNIQTMRKRETLVDLPNASKNVAVMKNS